jgi:hypothetical protein
MKYILGFLGFIVIVVVAIVLLTGGNKSKPSGPKVIKLADYANNSRAYVEYTTDGPINAEENHRTVRITINPTYRTIDVIKGYQGDILRTKTYPNNDKAYEEFLSALIRAGFTAGRKTSATFGSVCPNGTRFQYKLVEGSKDVQNLWSANCNRGTFGGDKNLTRTLFQAQIPEYTKLTNDVVLGGSTSAL